MTRPDEKKKHDDETDDDLELSKETIKDLDAPDDEAAAVKGGVSMGCGS